MPYPVRGEKSRGNLPGSKPSRENSIFDSLEQRLDLPRSRFRHRDIQGNPALQADLADLEGP